MKYLLYTILIFFAQLSFAQSIQITSIGTGNTKQEALFNALRESVSEAYGTFVSSKTSIDANDNFVDDIVMLTQGNILNYRELEYNHDTHTIVICATISLQKLNTYVNNHGSTVNINGSSFVANYDLSYSNEAYCKKSLDYLYDKLLAISQQLYNYEITLTEPVIKNKDVYVDIRIQCNPTKQLHIFNKVYETSLFNINKYTDYNNTFIRYFFKSFNDNVYELRKTACFNFEIIDNLGNNICCCIRDIQYDTPYLLCSKKLHDGYAIFCKSNGVRICKKENIPILRYNDTYNQGFITFRLKYTIEQFRRLSNIQIIPSKI